MLDLKTYRINYEPEAWKRIAEETGAHCCAPIGAVLAVNALCNEVESLRQQLNTFTNAVQHVTEDGKTRRSFFASEGWAMVHSGRLLDLEIIEEKYFFCGSEKEESLRQQLEQVTKERDALVKLCHYHNQKPIVMEAE